MAGGLLQRNQGTWIREDAADLDRKLREGDGVGWAGDPRLELKMAVITARQRTQHPTTGKWLNRGDVVAKRWEVHRVCEDGKARMIGHWRIEEFDRILRDLAVMRTEAAGHKNVTESIDAHNAELEAKANQDIRDNLGLALDHGARLLHDLTQPRNVFRGMPGRRDELAAERSENAAVPQPAEQGGS